MATRPIKITGSNVTTGDLILDDHGHTVADPGDTILWQVGNGSGVLMITLINGGSGDIWQASPTQQSKNNWRGVIKDDPLSSSTKYSIFWKAYATGPVLEYDPIISIRPTLKSSIKPSKSLLFTIITFILGAVGLSYFIHFIMKGKKKK